MIVYFQTNLDLGDFFAVYSSESPLHKDQIVDVRAIPIYNNKRQIYRAL